MYNLLNGTVFQVQIYRFRYRGRPGRFELTLDFAENGVFLISSTNHGTGSSESLLLSFVSGPRCSSCNFHLRMIQQF